MHRDSRMRKVLVATISSAGFIFMTLNYKLSKIVAYITYDKYWKRCYVILKIMFPFLKVICLTYTDLAVMDKVYINTQERKKT